MPTFSRDLPQGGRHVPAKLKFSSADERLLHKCQELVTKNLSGLFGTPQMANKSLFVTCEAESDSKDEEYEMRHDSQNEQRPHSPPAADQPCSSTSAATCTTVIKITDTSNEQETVIVID